MKLVFPFEREQRLQKFFEIFQNENFNTNRPKLSFSPSESDPQSTQQNWRKLRRCRKMSTRQLIITRFHRLQTRFIQNFAPLSKATPALLASRILLSLSTGYTFFRFDFYKLIFRYQITKSRYSVFRSASNYKITVFRF